MVSFVLQAFITAASPHGSISPAPSCRFDFHTQVIPKHEYQKDGNGRARDTTKPEQPTHMRSNYCRIGYFEVGRGRVGSPIRDVPPYILQPTTQMRSNYCRISYFKIRGGDGRLVHQSALLPLATYNQPEPPTQMRSNYCRIGYFKIGGGGGVGSLIGAVPPCNPTS